MAGPTAVEGEFGLLGELMDAAADQIGAHEAMVDGDRRLTFARWVAAADEVADRFVAAGVGHGDVVAMHIGNGLEYAVCYAAAVRLGAIATGINLRLGPSEVEGILAACHPKVLVHESGDPGVRAAAGSMPRTSRIIGIDEIRALVDAAPAAPTRRFGEICNMGSDPMLQNRSDDPATVGVQPTDPVCIIWTSGTTGMPKGAWFDHRNLAGAVDTAGVMTMAFDRRLGGLPFPHAGYMAKLWEHFAMGVTLVLSATPWTAQSMLDTLVGERITVAAGVPTQWAKLLELPGLDTADFSTLRLGLSATAPAPPELIERVVAVLGCPLVVRYAMTESPSITGTEPDDPPLVQFRTVGRPQGDMEVVLVDDAGEPVPDGEVGRVTVRGSAVMRGYWNDPDRTAAVLAEGGTLRSSDLGRFDADGNLVLAGRVDDLYIRGGYNVYPMEVEHVLAEHPAVAQVAVVGVPTAVIGELGVAFVVPADPASPPSLDDLRTWVGDRLADYKRPDVVEIVDALPLTAMLKVDKAALRATRTTPG